MISNKTTEVKRGYFFLLILGSNCEEERDCNPSHSNDGGRKLHGIDRTVGAFHVKKKIALASWTL